MHVCCHVQFGRGGFSRRAETTRGSQQSTFSLPDTFLASSKGLRSGMSSIANTSTRACPPKHIIALFPAEGWNRRTLCVAEVGIEEQRGDLLAD